MRKRRKASRRLRELLTWPGKPASPRSAFASICRSRRGLDYYTGTIYETFLLDKPDIGSVCSGGRYDNLAGLYTKQQLPGVGASLGLDRLLAAMEELDLLPKHRDAGAGVDGAVRRRRSWARIRRWPGCCVRRASASRSIRRRRSSGRSSSTPDQRGFKLALIAGPDEFARGVWKLKNLTVKKTGEKPENEETIPENEVVAAVRRTLDELDE